MNLDKLIITVSKKGSSEIIARAFRDGDAIKAIVDNDYDLEIDGNEMLHKTTSARLEKVLIEWLEERKGAIDESSQFTEVARVLLDLLNSKQ